MRLSLCIVGCGRYARTVLQEIHDMSADLQLFFASRDSQKAQGYCETYGGAGFFGSCEEAAKTLQSPWGRISSWSEAR